VSAVDRYLMLIRNSWSSGKSVGDSSSLFERAHAGIEAGERCIEAVEVKYHANELQRVCNDAELARTLIEVGFKLDAYLSRGKWRRGSEE